MNEVRDALQLKNVDIYPHKISPDFHTQVKSVITRALEPISKTLQRISSCLEIGGLAIFMKGPSIDTEMKRFKKLFFKKYKFLQNHVYSLPLINHQRRLAVLERLIDGP